MITVSTNIIYDTMATMFSHEAENTLERGASIPITENEYSSMAGALKKLFGKILSGKVEGFRYNEREYTFIQDKCRLVHLGDESLRAEMIFRLDRDETSQRWINVTYSLYRHNRGGYRLSFIGNPTSVLNGNNVSGVRVVEAKALQEKLSYYQVGFKLFESVVGVRYSAVTSRIIQRGSFKIANTQWALYLPAPNKVHDISFIAGLFCGGLQKKEGYTQLAEYLGFQAVTGLRGSKGRLSGVFLTKKHANNHVLTVNFYDKAESLKNKKQYHTLTDTERHVVDNSIRLDITAHTDYLQTIILLANKHLEKLLEAHPQLTGKFKQFRQQLNVVDAKNRPEVTAYMICRAMNILAIEFDAKKFALKDFTPWLVKRILETELRLMSLMKCDPNSLNFTAPNGVGKLVEAWREYDGTNLAKYAKEKYGIQKTAFYKYRQAILDKYNVDVSIPYSYWVDYGFISATYGLSKEESGELYEALHNPDYSDRKAGKIVQKMQKIREQALSEGKQTLLMGLQLVAREIPATRVNFEKLGWSWSAAATNKESLPV